MKKFGLWFGISLFLIGILTAPITRNWAGDPVSSRSKPSTNIGVADEPSVRDNSSDIQASPVYRWGYMNRDGRLVIFPHFDYARPFSDGIAAVGARGTNIDFINREGEVVIRVPHHDRFAREIRDFSEGLMPLRKKPEGKIGYIDTTGAFAIAPRFEFARSFQEGRAAVSWYDASGRLNGGYIDRSGEVVIDVGEGSPWDFHQGVATVGLPGRYGLVEIEQAPIARYGLIDREGNFVMEPILAEVNPRGELGGPAYIEFYSERLRVQVGESEAGSPYPAKPEWIGKWGYVAQSGGWAIEPQFDTAGNFSEGRAVVANEREDNLNWWERGILIDKEGRHIETSRQEPEPKLKWWDTKFHEGLAVVEAENGKWGYIDREGRWAIEPQFAHGWNFSSGLAAVKTKEYKWGYIDREGRWAIEPQFDWATDFRDSGFAEVKVGERAGLIDRSGQYVIEPKYAWISDFVNGIAVLGNASGEPYFYMNKDFKIFPCPHWGHRTEASEGLIAIQTEVPLREGCQVESPEVR